MGSPKALLVLAGRPVVAWHCERLGPYADLVVVVVGWAGDEVRAVLPPGIRVVVNEDWATTTPIDSLALGLGSASSALVLPVDVLPAAPQTLQAVARGEGDVVPVGPDGQEGHPVRIGAPTVDRIRQERPDGGLRRLLLDAPRVRVDDPQVGWDFDDPAAFARAAAAFAERTR